MKRAASFALAFLSALALIRCASYLATSEDTESNIAAVGVGVILFALVVVMAAASEEMDDAC